ncbi:MAG: MerR family transcriptional regulator [Polaromonas sp.]
MEKFLPPIPAKRYFTISEVSNLCGVKPHVLRYWEQEFTQLRPMKRRGNRRYYQHLEVLMIRKIRDLLYEQGFTIIGARSKLHDFVHTEPEKPQSHEVMFHAMDERKDSTLPPDDTIDFESSTPENADWAVTATSQQRLQLMRRELLEIRELLRSSC